MAAAASAKAGWPEWRTDERKNAATLAAFVDRSLPSEEYATVEAHVADCTACIEHLALVTALDAPEESSVPTPAVDVGALVRRWGGSARALPFIDGYSTTALVRRIRAPEPG